MATFNTTFDMVFRGRKSNTNITKLRERALLTITYRDQESSFADFLGLDNVIVFRLVSISVYHKTLQILINRMLKQDFA